MRFGGVAEPTDGRWHKLNFFLNSGQRFCPDPDKNWRDRVLPEGRKIIKIGIFYWDSEKGSKLFGLTFTDKSGLVLSVGNVTSGQEVVYIDIGPDEYILGMSSLLSKTKIVHYDIRFKIARLV